MRPFTILLLLLLVSLFSFGQNLKSGGKLIPEQANMDIRHYTLNLEVDPANQSIDGYTEIRMNLAKEAESIVLDLVHLLQVKQVWVNGKKENFTHENDRIFIRAAEKFAAGPQLVKIAYGGKPGIAERAPWVGGFQWEKDSKGNPWIAISCQGEGAKIYFPCKDHPSDEPNEGADLHITVPKGLTVAGPGLLQKVRNRGNKSTFHWKTNYTISNYCILFNVGKYKLVTRDYTSVEGNKIPMHFYVLEENAEKGPYHLELLERSCRVLEKYFGEYPWAKEKIGIAETPHLGMEHQTMNAYGNKFRYTKVGGYDFDWLLHHEFGHEWWANKVTNADWGHMWIQEGICTYGDALIVRDLEGEEAYRARMRQTARNAGNKLPIVQGDEVDSDQAYYGDIYGKGAFFMHSLRFIMGDELFFPTLKKLATDPAYTYDNTVMTADVEALFSGAYGKSLKPYFHLFLYTTQKLEIGVKQKSDTSYELKLLNLDMEIPLEIETEKGRQTIRVSKDAVTIQASGALRVDPQGFYMKKVIFE
jgi:aminopeptidase N